MKTAIFVVAVFACVFAENLYCGLSGNIGHWKKIFENDKNGITSKILGGTFSAKGNWPWVVSLHGCTGSIIHPNWVITARHCQGVAGSIGYGDPDSRKQQFIGVNETFIPNPGCMESCLTNECRERCFNGYDILLLRLEEPIPFSPYASPICLKRNISEKWGDFEAAAGWGTFLIPDSDAAGGYSLEHSPHCREVDIPMRTIEQGYCDTFAADDEHELCAGTWNHGTTPGDSGGPTMALIDDRWYLHGITSRGNYLQNDDPQMFRDQGIYTDASSHCDWIAETTNGDVVCQ